MPLRQFGVVIIKILTIMIVLHIAVHSEVLRASSRGFFKHETVPLFIFNKHDCNAPQTKCAIKVSKRYPMRCKTYSGLQYTQNAIYAMRTPQYLQYIRSAIQ